MKKEIAVVTGGAGFIGSHMVDLLLSKNYRVHVIDNLSGGHKKNLRHHSNNPNLVFENVDICKLKSNNKLFKGAKYVFHFAGIGDIVPSIESPTSYMNINIHGTIKVLEASKNASIKKFLYAASSSCYGLAKTPTSENHTISPKYPYALSKYLGEKAAFHWHKVYGLPVNSIRIFNAYGTRVRTTGVYGAVFGVFFKQKLENKPLTVVGNGSQKRDFLYVTDVAKAFFKSAKSRYIGEIYNLGAGKPQSIKYLVKIIGGKTTTIRKRPGEPDCTWANISKIKNHLKWEPKIKFKNGVKKMLYEIENWKNAPLWTPVKIEMATKMWFKFMSKKDKKNILK